jgi:hypothetical protein
VGVAVRGQRAAATSCELDVFKPLLNVMSKASLW